MATQYRPRKWSRPGSKGLRRRIGRDCVLALIVLLAAHSTSPAAERRLLTIEDPPSPGTYRVVGTFYFNPGMLDSPDQVRVFSLSETSAVDLFLLDSETWPGDGVMCVTVGFVATRDDLLDRPYSVEWGGARQTLANKTHAGLPTLRMEMETTPAGDRSGLPVGTMVVKVRKHPEIYYYWYLIPIAIVVLVLVYRKFKYFRN